MLIRYIGRYNGKTRNFDVDTETLKSVAYYEGSNSELLHRALKKIPLGEVGKTLSYHSIGNNFESYSLWNIDEIQILASNPVDDVLVRRIKRSADVVAIEISEEQIKTILLNKPSGSNPLRVIGKDVLLKIGEI